MKPSLFLHRRRARGVTLIEALVALLVMSFGMVALVGLLGNLRRSTDVGKQRSEAMRLAQAEMARIRAFSVLQKADPTDTTVSDYEQDITSSAQASNVTVADSNTTYSLRRVVNSLATGESVWGKTTQVEVAWIDRASRSIDAPQKIVLDSIVARVDPAFAGAASIAPPPGVVKAPQNRNPAIPAGAPDLGNRTSAFRPSGLSSTVWVFNNVTGAITKVCSIAPATALNLTNVAAAGCTDTLGFLISGTVNFSNTNPANPAVPEALAQNLDMTITGGTYRAAQLTGSGVPARDAGGNIIWDTVTVAAPSFQCFDDAPTGAAGTQTFANYYCLVVPSTSPSQPSWSGAVKITGLSLGTTAADYRVCRYSADYNGNGNGYANVKLEPDNYEHPEFYVKVTGSIARQNFLVVRGDVSCPTAPAVDLSAGVYADYSTVQIQP